MAKFTHDVIIIGAGAAGLYATVGCAKLGMKVALIEKERRLGGDCLYYGCVPSKSLLRAASLYWHSNHLEHFGMRSGTVPPADLGEVNKRVQSVIATIAQHDSIERFESLGAEVMLGNARFLNEHELNINRQTVSAKHIVIATGSSPFVADIPGLKSAGFITNIDVFSMKKLPAALTIIGAGPIGIEMCMAFARLGSKVSLIDRNSAILAKDDPDMVEVIAGELSALGVHYINNASVERVTKDKGKKIVHYTQGDVKHTVASDEILVSIGRRGNAESLELDKAGVVSNRSFIPTNAKLQTSTKHIYAIGDSNGQYLFTHTAAAEASVIVRRVALRIGGTIDYKGVPWVTYTDPELASVGYNEEMLQKQGTAYSAVLSSFDRNDRALAEGATQGRIKILIDKKDQMLGVQIVGYHAGDLITPSLFAVRDRWKINAFLGPIFPYPTTGEIYKRAIGEHIGPRLFNNRVRGIMRFLHGYRGKRK